AQGEYYLTDVIGVLLRSGARVDAIVVSDAREAVGVNDRKQLAAVTAIQRRRILDRLMEGGVTILDPASTYIEDTVTIGADTTIYPNVVIEGQSAIGSECVVGAGSHVRACTIGDHGTLLPYCVRREPVIEDAAILGPFCHLRPLA